MFYVPCNMNGVPLKIHSGPEGNSFCDVASNQRRDFHAGICFRHNCAVGVFRSAEASQVDRRYTLRVERGGVEDEVFWDIPGSYGFHILFFVCPFAQRLECGHIYFQLIRSCDRGAWREFVVCTSKVEQFFKQ